MTTHTSISKKENGTTIIFELKSYYNNGKLGYDSKDHYVFKQVVYKTKESANNAGNTDCVNWGSNLRYLGFDEIIIDGVVYFKNNFNVWD